jgi:hypothetical protein
MTVFLKADIGRPGFTSASLRRRGMRAQALGDDSAESW